MQALRNKRFRRWLAGSLAVTWFFTVLACAADTDIPAAESAHVSQPASSDPTADLHQHDGGVEDPCCHWQASAVASSSAVKLPGAVLLHVIVPLVFLFRLTLSATLIGPSAAPDPGVVRRRFEFLVHSLPSQAPPSR